MNTEEPARDPQVLRQESVETFTAKFTAKGGWPHQLKEAKEVLTLGETYEIVKWEMASWHTDITLKGIDGTWNSCMFEYDEKTMIEQAVDNLWEAP
jgi:hypothetical protein